MQMCNLQRREREREALSYLKTIIFLGRQTPRHSSLDLLLLLFLLRGQIGPPEGKEERTDKKRKTVIIKVTQNITDREHSQSVRPSVSAAP